ncbi:hypothetical protein [Nonomuraea sp. GTA35]|uniref:hypothetical protein n=1 Tax=Nonomuraea sp. GTA35 TaxID=1676746 RepID=UPI0035C09A55
MPHRLDLQAAADGAEKAVESFTRQGRPVEAAVSRCMASHYREALPSTDARPLQEVR